MKKKLLVAAMGGLTLFAAGSARANTITLTDAASNYIGGQFNYNVQFSDTSVLNTGDGFIIYDFAGYVSGSGIINMSDFTITSGSGNFGFDGEGVAVETALGPVVDNPSIDNIFVEYTGTNGFSVGPALATLTLYSDYQTTGMDQWISEDTALPTGSAATGRVTVAVEGQNAIAPVPAAVWGGLALFGMIGGSRLRKRVEV